MYHIRPEAVGLINQLLQYNSVQTVVNSRSLTYESEDPEEWKPLTPADFLGRYNPLLLEILIPIIEGGLPPRAPVFVRAARASMNYSRHLALRWQKEYLTQLRSANVDDKPTEENDVALLRDPSRARVH